MVRASRKFWQLSQAERGLLLQALLLFPLTALGLHFLGFKRLYHGLTQSSSSILQQDRYQNSLPVEKIVNLVQIANRWGCYRGNCLQQSLVLWWLLRSQGYDSDLKIGVRRQAGEIEAHAWIEFQGEVLNDRADIQQVFSAFAQTITAEGGRNRATQILTQVDQSKI